MLILGKFRCNRVVNALREFIALLDRVRCRIDRLSKNHFHFSGPDDERIFLHDAMRPGAGHRHNLNARLDGDHEGTFLESAEASVRAARSFGINQERVSFADVFHSLLNAGERSVAIFPVYGNKFRQAKCGADDGNIEQRFPSQNSNAPRNGADDSGRVRVAGVIRGKKADARRNIFPSFHGHFFPRNSRHVDHHFHPSPIHQRGRLGHQRQQNERRPKHKGAERHRDCNKCCAYHLREWLRRAGYHLGCAAAFPWGTLFQ